MEININFSRKFLFPTKITPKKHAGISYFTSHPQNAACGYLTEDEAYQRQGTNDEVCQRQDLLKISLPEFGMKN